MGIETIPSRKCIALVAHDKRKNELIDWLKRHKKEIKKHHLCATGTTGTLISEKLEVPVKKFKSGPIGGDQQIGAEIVNGKVDVLIFFWDPLESMPHDPDIKALLRLATMWNIPVACNQSTADFLLTSPLISKRYKRDLSHLNDYQRQRKIL